MTKCKLVLAVQNSPAIAQRPNNLFKQTCSLISFKAKKYPGLITEQVSGDFVVYESQQHMHFQENIFKLLKDMSLLESCEDCYGKYFFSIAFVR